MRFQDQLLPQLVAQFRLMPFPSQSTHILIFKSRFLHFNVNPESLHRLSLYIVVYTTIMLYTTATNMPMRVYVWFTLNPGGTIVRSSTRWLECCKTLHSRHNCSSAICQCISKFLLFLLKLHILFINQPNIIGALKGNWKESNCPKMDCGCNTNWSVHLELQYLKDYLYLSFWELG